MTAARHADVGLERAAVALRESDGAFCCGDVAARLDARGRLQLSPWGRLDDELLVDMGEVALPIDARRIECNIAQSALVRRCVVVGGDVGLVAAIVEIDGAVSQDALLKHIAACNVEQVRIRCLTLCARSVYVA